MANTTYTFRPRSTTPLVNWNDPSAWTGGVVPNSPSADVVIPIATLSGGGTYMSFITISAGEVFTEYSLTVAGNGVNLAGTLSLTDALTNLQQSSVQLFGGTLNAGSVVNGGNIGGYGQVTVSGALTNDYQIAATNGDLTVTAHSLVNNGLMSVGSGGRLIVNVDPGGFANLVGTTLSGGSYVASWGGALQLNVGGPIETNAATISLGIGGGGSIASFDPSSGGYVLLQSSLHSVATSGVLSLTGQAWNWGTLSIDGSLTLANNATLTSPQLTVGAGGHISGSGTIAAPIVNSGTITASGTASESVLNIAGPVTGSGSLVISPGSYWFGTQAITPTLELGGPTSQAVTFSNNLGALILDDPHNFTGTIAPSSLFNQISTGDQIILTGLSLSGLQGYSYTGNSTGGVLSLQEASGTTDLHIVGEFNVGSFNFSAGPQFLTTSPPSLKVTVGGLVKLANDTGVSSTDNVTSDPTVTETAYPSAMVKLVVDGTPLANSLQANAQGVWSYTPTGLADGTHTIVATEFVYGPHATTVPLGTASLTFVLDSDPTVASEAYVAMSGQTLVATAAAGVLANDAAATTTTVQTAPAHGALQLNSDGSFSYTPTANYSGIDSFTYHVSGGSSATDNGQALVYVVPTVVGASTTLDLLALNAEQQIAATYIAFFGRGADASGFEFWVDQFTTGATQQTPAILFANIASSFGVSSEAQGLYPFLAHPQGASDGEISSFLDSVYNNLFNRSSDAGGLAYWTDQIHQTLAAGQFVGSVLVDIISGTQNTASGQDITTLMGKVAVGLSYVQEQERLGTAWSFADDGAAATALLHSVTAEPQTVLVGIAQAQNLVFADLH
jgi:hypothetical protein